MKRALVLLSCILLACPAIAQTPAPSTTTTSQAPLSAATESFIQQVAISDLFETASARLALARGNEAQQQFANQMLQDHGKTSGDVRRLIVRDSLKVDVPSQLDAPHQALLDKLSANNGDDFVVTYAAQQVEAHQKAVALFQSYASNGDLPALKQWAGRRCPCSSIIWRWRRSSARQRPARRQSARRPRRSDRLICSGCARRCKFPPFRNLRGLRRLARCT